MPLAQNPKQIINNLIRNVSRFKAIFAEIELTGLILK
jgi:hypothetical protein